MRSFSPPLLKWYRKHARVLPWRGLRDPYAIWISEIMLQQTRVDTAIPYFEKWLKRFPNVETLARSAERDVLSAWEGLGYYSRARNLHRAAQMIVDQYGGQLPQSIELLSTLPGIGSYTAAAIASIAFGADEVSIDANLRRVLARVFDFAELIDSVKAQSRLRDLAMDHLPKGNASEFNQALMDLGAAICLPKNPRCDQCPIKAHCLALARSVVDQRPVVRSKSSVPLRQRIAAVIKHRGRVLLAQRSAHRLLGGMWEFPNVAAESKSPRIANLFYQELGIDLQSKKMLGEIDHAYSHFKLSEKIFECELIALPKKHSYKWIPISRLGDHPMGKVDRQIANLLK
jgi:A/G-specific adenine glycosylase